MFETVFGLVVLLGCIFVLWFTFRGKDGKRKWNAFVSDSSGKFMVFLLVFSLLLVTFMLVNDPYRGWFH